MELNKFLQSRQFQIATRIIAGLIALLLAFKLGMSIGYKKAAFSYQWGENYHRNFGGPRGGFLKDFLSDRRDYLESHGVFGQIVSREPAVQGEPETLIVKGRDNAEKVILIERDTVVTRLREKADASSLNAGDFVVVIGQPNDDGRITAKLIRIMPGLSAEGRPASPPPPPAQAPVRPFGKTPLPR